MLAQVGPRAFLALAGLVAALGCSESQSGSEGEPSRTEGASTSSPSTNTTASSSGSSSGMTSSGTGGTTGGETANSSSTSSSTGSVVTSGSTSSNGSGGSGGSGADAGSGGSGGGSEGDGLDVFGIEELYPSHPNGALWTSEHWSTEGPYSITERIDENDPLAVSGLRGTGTLEVTDQGVLVMGGSQPRLYVYESEVGPWRDVEVTVYYQRVADDATAWGGLVIGARSGPEGHGDTPCDAHTYYSRLRHDGATDFEKELMHTPSSTQSRVEPEVLWPPNGELPFDTWIGYKYVIYNLPDGGGVRLRSYRDLSEGVDGGTWELVNETVDAGGWFTQTTCEEHEPVNGESDLVYLDPGVTLIRNTGVTEARYRWVSVREIAP